MPFTQHMGIFKDIKGMKDMVHAAPGMINQAQTMAANAQQMGQAQQAAAQAQMAAFNTVNPADLVPISNVTIETYASIVKHAAAAGSTEAVMTALAGAQGIDSPTWATAYAGWNARLQGNPGLATHFGRIYQAA